MPTILEDYFDFSDPGEIRIQGHRVYLHHVLFDYVDGMTFEKLCEDYDTLSKDEILACLLYYHRNQEAMNKYLADLRAFFDRQREELRKRQVGLGDELRRRRAATEAARQDRNDPA